MIECSPKYRVAEFFAGIGLVRMGLERGGLKVVWANDIDEGKAAMYRGHFQDDPDHYKVQDVASVDIDEIPEGLSLAWASFPCTDVSLAGNRGGLNGRHTGTFWGFIEVMGKMGKRKGGSLPPVIALENVTGLATSRGGSDLREAVRALNDLGYSVDALVIDARSFVPQSRPRLFLVGAQQPLGDIPVPNDPLRPKSLQPIFLESELRTHRVLLPPPGPMRKLRLADCVEELADDDQEWWSNDSREKFLGSLSPIQSGRLEKLRNSPGIHYRAAYRRTRHGRPVWEIRADDLAGCLRTARGGSSKQALVRLDSTRLDVRWMTGREYGDLMGADGYSLDGLRRNQIIFGFGDAVCVDAVAWLTEHYLKPLIQATDERRIINDE